MPFHPPLVQMGWVKSSLLWCCSALCTAHIAQGWEPLTVKSLRASSERLQANQPRAPSSKPPQLKVNKTKAMLSLLPPGSATTVTTSTERDGGCVNAEKGYFSSLLERFVVQIFTTTKIHDKNTKHRSQTESQYQQLINTMRYFSISLIFYTVTR